MFRQSIQQISILHLLKAISSSFCLLALGINHEIEQKEILATHFLPSFFFDWWFHYSLILITSIINNTVKMTTFFLKISIIVHQGSGIVHRREMLLAQISLVIVLVFITRSEIYLISTSSSISSSPATPWSGSRTSGSSGRRRWGRSDWRILIV